MKYLALILTFVIFAGIHPVSAHTQTTTVYETEVGAVHCLNHEGISIDKSFCNPHTEIIGDEPPEPQIQCPIQVPVPHTHGGGGEGRGYDSDRDGDGNNDNNNGENA